MPTLLEKNELPDADFWNRTAQKYSRSMISDVSGYERTLARTRELLGCSDIVLEIGCGTGNTAMKLAPTIGHITGTDISSEMIAIANGRKADVVCSNATFTVTDARSPHWPEQHFDAVLAFNLLHLIRDRPAFFHSVGRALKPGGLFITKTPCLSEMNAAVRFAVPFMKLIGKAPFLSFFTAEELVSELAASRFTIIDEARHGSRRKDFRVFIAARKAEL